MMYYQIWSNLSVFVLNVLLQQVPLARTWLFSYRLKAVVWYCKGAGAPDWSAFNHPSPQKTTPKLFNPQLNLERLITSLLHNGRPATIPPHFQENYHISPTWLDWPKPYAHLCSIPSPLRNYHTKPQLFIDPPP